MLAYKAAALPQRKWSGMMVTRCGACAHGGCAHGGCGVCDAHVEDPGDCNALRTAGSEMSPAWFHEKVAGDAGACPPSERAVIKRWWTDFQ